MTLAAARPARNRDRTGSGHSSTRSQWTVQYLAPVLIAISIRHTSKKVAAAPPQHEIRFYSRAAPTLPELPASISLAFPSTTCSLGTMWELARDEFARSIAAL